MIRRIIPIILIAILTGLLLPLHAQTVDDNLSSIAGDTNAPPLWEAGLLAGWALIPQYRGSDQYRNYVLPLPYIIYRGSILQADRDGLRGIFFKHRYFETSLSASGYPPVDKDNNARVGMEEIDALGELGPALRWLIVPRNADHAIYLQASLRGVASVDLSDWTQISYRGLHGGLTLVYRRYHWGGDRRWNFGGTIGVDVTDQEYNSYLYDVPDENVLPDRPAFSSGGGYAGCAVSGNILRRLSPNLSLACYARWQNLDGAVYENSPLVKENNDVMLGAALIWRFFVSAKQAGS